MAPGARDKLGKLCLGVCVGWVGGRGGRKGARGMKGGFDRPPLNSPDVGSGSLHRFVWATDYKRDWNAPPRPVLTPVPSSPVLTISASAYLVSSALILPAPPRPWETSGPLIFQVA